jgi:hypothetical protein
MYIKKFENNKTKKVFLGGTCAESDWRDKLIKKLKIDFFNPVVDDWTEDDQKEEIRQRKICDFCLYVITPRMKGVYSIAEVVDDSNKRPEKTIFCYLQEDGEDINGDKYKFTKEQLKSLKQVGKMILDNNAYFFETLNDVADFLNDNKNKND